MNQTNAAGKNLVTRDCILQFWLMTEPSEAHVHPSDVAGTFQMKHATTSQWNVAKMPQYYVSTTSYQNVVTTSQGDLMTTSYQYVSTMSQTSLK